MSATTDMRSGAELQAELVAERMTMIARTLVAVIDGTEDDDAFGYVRALAASSKPSADLAAFVARLQEGRTHRSGPPIDANAATRAERERLYREMPAGLNR